jgi:hypothetical protein
VTIKLENSNGPSFELDLRGEKPIVRGASASWKIYFFHCIEKYLAVYKQINDFAKTLGCCGWQTTAFNNFKVYN